MVDHLSFATNPGSGMYHLVYDTINSDLPLIFRKQHSSIYRGLLHFKSQSTVLPI